MARELRAVENVRVEVSDVSEGEIATRYPRLFLAEELGVVVVAEAADQVYGVPEPAQANSNVVAVAARRVRTRSGRSPCWS